MLMQIYQRSLRYIVTALNYDFCPRANSFVYWLKQPVGWVVYAIAASLLVGFFVGPQGFVLAGAFVALLVLGVLWPWLCMKGISCELKFTQPRSVEGEPINVTLEVINRLPVPTFGLMIQGKFLQNLIHDDDEIAVSLKHVPGWSVSSFQWPLVPNRRGELPTESPHLSTGFPFGLYQMSKTVQIIGRTIVWPKTSELETPVETIGTQFAIDATAGRQSGNDGETIGVRDYRYGDSVRNIHWSQTARHNRLILREKQSHTQTPMRVVLDLTPEHHQGLGSQGTYEKAIRLAASICSELHRHQFQIDLDCLGLAEDVPAKANNRRGLNSMLDFLAQLPVFDIKSVLQVLDKPNVTATIKSSRVFTFLIHTERFMPVVDESRIKCFCVDSVSEANSEIETFETFDQSPLPVSVELPSPDVGATYVST